MKDTIGQYTSHQLVELLVTEQIVCRGPVELFQKCQLIVWKRLLKDGFVVFIGASFLIRLPI